MTENFGPRSEAINPGGSIEPIKYERVFIALPISPPTCTELTALRDDNLRQFRWNEEADLHLTLKFIGEVDSALKDIIAKKLEEIVVEPFILPVEDIGVFPVHGQPQVVYAGVGSAHPRLFQLQHRVEDMLASLGLPLELRAFCPHITLARVSKASPAQVREFLKRHRDFSAPPFKVESFKLYRTQMTHFGSEYTPLNEYPLRMKQAKAG